MSKNSDKIKKLKTALKNSPSDIKVLSSLVEIYLRCGDTKNALKQVDEFTKRFTDTNVHVQFLWGRVYETTKQVELAERYYKQVFDWYEQHQDSRSVDAYIHLGNYWRGKDDARSFSCYHRAYQLGCVEPEVVEQLKQIFGTFVSLFNQGWFIVHQNNKIFAYGSTQKIASSIQINSSESSSWCEQIINFLSQPQWVVDLEFFTLPIDIEKNEIVCQNLEQIKKLKQKFICPRDELVLNQVAYRAVQCAVDSLEIGTQPALQSFVEDWLSWEQDALSLAFSARLWHKLFHSGWFQSDMIPFLTKVFARYGDVLNALPRQLSQAKHNLVSYNLNYSIQSFEIWNGYLFRNFIVSSIRLALQSNNYYYADRLAIWTDFSYAQQPMIEAQQLLCRNAYVSETRQAGKLVADTLPKLALQKNQKPIKIAFVINLVFSHTSPVSVLLDIQQKISQLSPLPLVAKIYAFYGLTDRYLHDEKKRLIDMFSSIGVEIVDISACRHKYFDEDDYLERLLFLRKRMQQDEISVAIYVQCSTFFIIFASAVKLAPIQIFFSMAIEGTFRLPELDAYLSLQGTFEHKMLLHGQEWRMIPGTLGGNEIYSKVPDQDTHRAKQIRAKFPSDAVILGTLGRPQKIDNDIFLDIVAEILHYSSQAIFLWFGEKELSSVKEKMKVRGILDRCLFQGWVNTYEYARVLDIHLDSYPFGTGVTMFTCMAVGVPAVFFHHLDEEEEIVTSISNIYIYPLWSGKIGSSEQQQKVKTIFTDNTGKNLYLHAKTSQEYIKYTQNLIDNVEFRNNVGKACQQFVTFMEEEIDVGRVFVQHIQEIVEEYQPI